MVGLQASDEQNDMVSPPEGEEVMRCTLIVIMAIICIFMDFSRFCSGKSVAHFDMLILKRAWNFPQLNGHMQQARRSSNDINPQPGEL